jgi:HEAT repeat protein
MTTSDVIAQLSDESDTVRACAAYNLGVIGDAEAVPALIDLLGSDSVMDRRAAALALGKIGGEEADSALEAALEDEDEVVQKFAAETMDLGRRAA